MWKRTRLLLIVLVLLSLTQLAFSGLGQEDNLGEQPDFWLLLLLIVVLLGVLAWWALRRPVAAGESDGQAAHGAAEALDQAQAVKEQAQAAVAEPPAAEPEPTPSPDGKTRGTTAELKPMPEPEPEPEPAPEPAAPAEPDDLRRIEGIGPKTATGLNELGIITFAQLAQADPEKLETDLKAAGVRIISGATATWPEQAALAAKGDWDGLEKLQASLKGGRRA